MNRYYVDGNTVRREEEPHQYKNNHKLSAAAKKNRNRNLKMNRGYIIFLAVICVMATFACVHYLRLKSELTSQKSQLTAKELEYSKLKADNDAYYNETVASVDLEAIRQKALNELGMKYINQDQIKYYTPGGAGYERQYQEVPTEE